jgi:ATP-dependent Lon protease
VQIYRKAAFRLVSEGIPQITVDAQSLTDYVGRPVFSHDRLYDMTPPGVVAGLAWTSMGETNLYFERFCKTVASQLRMHEMCVFPQCFNGLFTIRTLHNFIYP